MYCSSTPPYTCIAQAGTSFLGDGLSNVETARPYSMCQIKAIKYELQVKVNVKNVKYANVKFSLRFLTHDAMRTCAGVEVQIHLFLTMTLD